MVTIDKQPLTSMNITEEQLQNFKQLFPEAFSEGLKIDWDKLRLTLGETVDVGKERYGMNWPGKADCFKTIQQPSIATLVPARDESINFDTTENLFIEGDNLEVLKLLQKSYLGKVKMIYIDPPYNTGNEFIYPDNYSENLETYLEYTGQVDSTGKKFGTNTDTDGRFHSKWLNMMYPRLFLAKNLLCENGVIFISIGEDEFSNLRLLMNEILGEENYISTISRVMKSGGNKGKFFSPNIDYLLVYAKNIYQIEDFKGELDDDLVKKLYNKNQETGKRKGEKYRPFGLYQSSLDSRPNQRYFIKCPDGSLAIPPGKTMPIDKNDGSKVTPYSNDGCWRWSLERYLEENENDNIVFIKSPSGVLIDENGNPSKWNVYTKIWLNDRQEAGQIPVNFITKYENRHSAKELKELEISFDFSKPVGLIKFLASICNLNNNDISLDFFAGSGTTAHAIMELNKDDGGNRKYICVQIPEPTDEKSEAYKTGYKNIAEISKERIRRVAAKIKKEQDEKGLKEAGSLFSSQNNQENQINQGSDLGFKVFKLDHSNFKIWDATLEKEPEAIQQRLFEHIDHISPEAAQESILYEL